MTQPRPSLAAAAPATASKHTSTHPDTISLHQPPLAARRPPHDSLNVTTAMATLAANDQENAVRHLHAAGGSKSLNAGIKGFNAKTPGNKAPKTPFKIPLNDENAVTKGAKSLLQTQGKGAELFTGGKGGKVDQNAFVTPAGMTE